MDLKSRIKIGFFTVLGFVTLLPASASHANVIGYESVCSFAPISSLILFGIAYKIYHGAESVSEKQVPA